MKGNVLAMSEYVIVMQNIPLGSKMTPLGSMRVNKGGVGFINWWGICFGVKTQQDM